MKLNIAERLILVNTLPEKGNFATLKTIEELKTKLYPSEKETKKYEIKHDGNNIIWNIKGKEEVEIEISEGQKELIIKSLKDLDKQEVATPSHMFLYEKFTEKENEK